MPKMGKSKSSFAPTPQAGLAGALFTGTQQRVLGLLFGQPDRSFYATELIKLAGVGSGAVQRELARLAQSRLVTVKPVGNQKHYQANPASPIYDELCGVVRKTVGLAEPGAGAPAEPRTALVEGPEGTTTIHLARAGTGPRIPRGPSSMSVTVRVPTTLRTLTAGQSEIAVEGGTVAEVLDNLESAHPGFKDRLLDDAGALRRFVNLYVADDDVRFRDGLATEVADGDTVSIIPAVAGGA